MQVGNSVRAVQSRSAFASRATDSSCGPRTPSSRRNVSACQSVSRAEPSKSHDEDEKTGRQPRSRLVFDQRGRPRIERFDRHGPRLRRHQVADRGVQVGEILKTCPDQNGRLGQRFEFQRQPRDDGERALRADEQFAQVVSGHVLDDAAARMEHAAVGRHGRQSDDIVAERPATEPARSAGIRGHRPAQRGPARLRDIDRQPLPFGFQDFGEPIDVDARFHGDGHVAGRKVDDSFEAAHVDRHGRLGQRPAEVERRSAADRGECPLRAGEVLRQESLQLILRWSVRIRFEEALARLASTSNSAGERCGVRRPGSGVMTPDAERQTHFAHRTSRRSLTVAAPGTGSSTNQTTVCETLH